MHRKAHTLSRRTKEQLFSFFVDFTECQKIMERSLIDLCCGCFAVFVKDLLRWDYNYFCKHYDIPLHSYIYQTSSTNQLFIVTRPTIPLTCIITVLPRITVSTLSYVV